MTVKIPDVAGFSLKDARAIIEKVGFEIGNVKVTRPPRSQLSGYDDSYRVIRYGLSDDNKIDLLLCNPLE